MNRTHIALFSAIILVGCTTEPNNKPIQFIVKVDSVSHPSFASTGDTVAIQLFGTIGSDGCHSFSRFEDSAQPRQLDLTVWGQRMPDMNCATVMIYLNGKEYRIVPKQQGRYIINIHQPNGGILRDSLLME